MGRTRYQAEAISTATTGATADATADMLKNDVKERIIEDMVFYSLVPQVWLLSVFVLSSRFTISATVGCLKTLLQHASTIFIAFLVLLQPNSAPQELAAKQLDPRLKPC